MALTRHPRWTVEAPRILQRVGWCQRVQINVDQFSSSLEEKGPAGCRSGGPFRLPARKQLVLFGLVVGFFRDWIGKCGVAIEIRADPEKPFDRHAAQGFFE